MKSKEELLKQLDELAQLAKSRGLDKVDPKTHLMGTLVDKSQIKKDAFGPTTQAALNSISSAFGSKPAATPPPPPPIPTSSSGAIKSMDKSMDNSPGKRWANDHDMVNRIKEIYGVSKDDEKSISANNNPQPGMEVAKSGSSPDQKSGNGELSEPVEKAAHNPAARNLDRAREEQKKESRRGKMEAKRNLPENDLRRNEIDENDLQKAHEDIPSSDSRHKSNMVHYSKLNDKQKDQARRMYPHNTPVSEHVGHNKPISHENYHYQVNAKGDLSGPRHLSQKGHHEGKLSNLKDQPKPNLPKSEEGENNLQKRSEMSSPDQKPGNGELGKAEKLSKPFSSRAQQRWGHTAAGEKALGGKSAVHEWDEATKGKKLPEKVEKKYEGFKEVEEKAKESGARNPAAVAAAAGRKKYGKKAFQAAAAAGHKMKKTDNPDEKSDAQLGEDVEHLVEDHMIANKASEKKEGHKIFNKSEQALEKAVGEKGVHQQGSATQRGTSMAGVMARTKGSKSLQLDSHKRRLNELKNMSKPNLPKTEKAESKHDRCVEEVSKEPGIKNPHAVCVAAGVKPSKWGKSEDICNIIETLSKSEKHKHIGWDKLHSKLENEGYSGKSADKIAGSIKAKVNKSDEKGVHKPAFMHGKKSGTSDIGARLMPDNKMSSDMKQYTKDSHKKVLGELKNMPKPNLPKSEADGKNLKKDSAKENPINDGITRGGSTTNPQALTANENCKDPVLNLLGRLKKGFFLP